MSSATSDSQNERERPKRTFTAPNPATARRSVGPPGAERRSVREVERHSDRADGRRGLQPAEPRGTDRENVLREDRQERRRAAEEHCEEVERERREDDRGAEEEGAALGERARLGRSLGEPARAR